MTPKALAKSAVTKRMLRAGRKERVEHVFLEQLEAMGPEKLVDESESAAYVDSDAGESPDEQALLGAGGMGIWGELYKRNFRLLCEANQALVEGLLNAAKQISATDAAAEPLNTTDDQGGMENILRDLWKQSILLQRW